MEEHCLCCNTFFYLAILEVSGEEIGLSSGACASCCASVLSFFFFFFCESTFSQLFSWHSSHIIPWGAWGKLRPPGLKDQCEMLKVCQSAGCSEYAGPADEAATLGRWCCRQGGGWSWEISELWLSSPAVAPLPPHPQHQSGLEGGREGSGFRPVKMWLYMILFVCSWRDLPADTSTTAMNSAISSGSRPKEPSFSLKSNMESSREVMPRARSDAKEYVWPFRKVTVFSLALNREQNLTIRTWEQNQKSSASETNTTSEGTYRKWLTCAVKFTWKVPDLSSMTWSCWLRVWNAGMLFANSTTSLTAGVKHWENDSHTSWLDRLAGATGQELSGHACRGEEEGGRVLGILNRFFFHIDSENINDVMERKKKAHQHFGTPTQLPRAAGWMLGIVSLEGALIGQVWPRR